MSICQEQSLNNSHQYLSFHLSSQEYAVNILNVTEIRGWEEPLTLPESPEYVKGVINLRGNIVPIIDLRVRFSLLNKKYDEFTVVIVLHFEIEGNRTLVGFVVDSVSDVYTFADDDVKGISESSDNLKREYLSGIVSHNNSMIVILEPSKIIADSIITTAIHKS